MPPSSILTTETVSIVSNRSSSFGDSKKLHLDIRNGVNTSKRLIEHALRARIEAVDHNVCDAGDEDTFFVADLGEVYRQHTRWKINLPRVRPFYAVKCNTDPQVTLLMAKLGLGFDCASKSEIDLVLKMGVDPTRIIYAQPCKTSSYVRYAASKNIRKMTFDNTDELYKIKKLFPDAELFLRISTDDSSSLSRLSLKFGATMDTTEELLDLAKELGLCVIGVSFHVGSGASDPLAYRKAVQDAHSVFAQATARGFNLRTLDVGGGFMNENFEILASALNEALEEFIPSHVSIIGEPGRYYVATAFTLATHVIARRTINHPKTNTTTFMLYLNDGLYGNFSGILYEHLIPKAKILRTKNTKCPTEVPAQEKTGSFEYSIWGPTCDGMDRIVESVHFDEIVNIGDWLYFENMGAYSNSCATRFNGFNDRHDIIYVASEPGARALMGTN